MQANTILLPKIDWERRSSVLTWKSFVSLFTYLLKKHCIIYFFAFILACNEFRRPNLKVKLLENVNAPKNSQVNLTMTLTADPLPELTWFQNGKEIEMNEYRKITSEVKELEHNLKEVTYNLRFPEGGGFFLKLLL